MANLKSRARSAIVGGLRAVVRNETCRRLMAEATAVTSDPLIEIMETIPSSRGDMQFYCVGEIPLFRARTLYTKEPETIEWLDTFKPGEIFWDIGANVGLYSIYAARVRGAKVMAFEPAAANYFLLNRNIEVNRLDGEITALCIALSSDQSVATLNMRNTQLGGALSSYNSTTDENGRAFTPVFRQGMLGDSVDGFIARYGVPTPDHIKIDVDGIESAIVAGAVKTLPAVQSVSIELDASRPEYSEPIISSLAEHGLKLVSKRHSPMFDSGPYSNIFNYLFRRHG